MYYELLIKLILNSVKDSQLANMFQVSNADLSTTVNFMTKVSFFLIGFSMVGCHHYMT